MKEYKTTISLSKNNRGVWDLDPFKGCPQGIEYNKKGCYSICYAAKIAKFRGYDFGKLVYRYFRDEKHLESIGNKLKKIPFVRLGVSCDPSSDWEHTLNIVDKIKPYQKNIVIITKHWNKLTGKQLLRLNGLCINTSISALDTFKQIDYRLQQYNLLKQYCKSVLRVNTCDFVDIKLKNLQDELLNNENVIDNILRIPKNHILVKDGIVNIDKYNFLNSNITASIYNKNTYFGHCQGCKEQCGINL